MYSSESKHIFFDLSDLEKGQPNQPICYKCREKLHPIYYFYAFQKKNCKVFVWGCTRCAIRMIQMKIKGFWVLEDCDLNEIEELKENDEKIEITNPYF
jgi:hypothetical protein